jgi:hypothetical protein
VIAAIGQRAPILRSPVVVEGYPERCATRHARLTTENVAYDQQPAACVEQRNSEGNTEREAVHALQVFACALGRTRAVPVVAKFGQGCANTLAARRFGYRRTRKRREGNEMSDALLTPMAVATGVVVIVVAIAVVLVVLFVTVSMRGRQKRAAQRRSETRHDLAAAHERGEPAERDRDIAEDQAQQRIDPHP